MRPTIFSWKSRAPRSIRSLGNRTFLFYLILCLCLADCTPKETWHTSTLLFFDTVCEIKVFCSSSRLTSSQKGVAEVFTDIEEHFSPGSTDYSSDIVLSLFLKAKDVYTASEGKFDLSVGVFSQIWGFRGHSYRVPTPEELAMAKRSIGMEKIQIQGESLILPPGMQLDWGAIAKGYGIDLASSTLRKKGILKGFVNAGGDLYCWGTNPDGLSWRIGIKHPRKPGFLGVIHLTDMAAATTGDYQRYFIEKGTRYHHVFDPHSGFPARGKQSVTVIGPETTICDALSTALFVSPCPQPILDRYSDYSAILIDGKGKVTVLGKPLNFEPSE